MISDLAPPLRRAAAGAIGAALIGGLVEGIGCVAVGGPPLTVLAAIGMWLLAAPVAACGLLGLSAISHLPPVRAGRQGLADDARRPTWIAAGVVLGAGLAGVLAGLGHGLIAIRPLLADKTLLVPIAPVLAALLIGLASAAGVVIAPLLAHLARRLRIGRRVGALILLAAASAPGLVLWPTLTFLARDLSLRPLAMALGAFALAALIQRLGATTRRAAALVVAGALLLALGLWAHARSPAARSALAVGLGLASAVVDGVHAATDRDGDGASPWLSGGDCDDADPTIHPEGVDVPGNGLDEDCDGLDAASVDGNARPLLARPSLPDGLVRPWNLLLVTIDTLRADRLPFHGYGRPTAPHLSRLAAEGWVVERAYTPANSTRYAFPSLFSGRALADMELDWLGRYLYVRPGNALLFERMAAAGWRIEAHLPRAMVDGMWYGLDAGVAEYRAHGDATLRGRSVPAINRGALGALDRFEERGGPWGLWVHYLEPHEPYRRNPEADFGSSPSDRYDGEIAAVDAGVGALIAALEARDLLDRTVVVITSDHGEEFEEHGRRYHGKQLYEESVRVPLVIRVPGATPRRIATPASLQDIAPTVAHLLGLRPNLDYGGRSLAGYGAGVEPDVPGRRLYFASYRNQRWPATYQAAVLQWPLKAIHGRGGGQVFDLAVDPGESRDIAPDGGHPLLGALEAEEARRRLAIRQGFERQGRVEPPPAILRATPQQVAPGLEFLGAQVAPMSIGPRALSRVDAWFRAVGPSRPDVQFEFLIVDPQGVVYVRYQRRPSAGLSSTRQWSAGDVVRLSHLVRVKDAVEGTIRVQLAARQGAARIWGPLDVARMEADAAR